MRKIFFCLLCVTIPIMVITSCKLEPKESEWYKGLEEMQFWAYDNDDGDVLPRPVKNFYKVDAALVYTGSNCEIWVDKKREVSREIAITLADKFDHIIYAYNSNYFGDYKKGLGTYWFENPDGAGEKEFLSDMRVCLLLLDIKDTYGKTQKDSYTAGYFDPNDLNWVDWEDDPKKTAYYTNSWPLLYIDTYPQDPSSQDALLTIAHEYQHLINLCQSIYYRAGNPMDTWIDEGLASAAEQIYLGAVPYQSRINHYNKDPYKTIEKGNNFFVWGPKGDNPNSVLDDYSTVYLFFQWLYLNYNGNKPANESIYRNIIESGYSDYRALTTTVSPNWNALLEGWLIANANPADGYKSKINNLTAHKASSGPQFLDPGEGIYCDSASPSGTSTIATANTSVSKYPVTVYNTETRSIISGQSVYVTSIASAEQNEQSAARSAASRGPHALDVWDMRGDRNRQPVQKGPRMGAEVKLRRTIHE